MCYYCGCEAEPLVEALMEDHAGIADLAYKVNRALDSGDGRTAAALTAEVARRFASHSLMEEAGLFAELQAAGEATEEVERLTGDHRRLRTQLADPDAAANPRHLRSLLADLAHHAETEDNDLFPFALQVLASERWERINERAASR